MKFLMIEFEVSLIECSAKPDPALGEVVARVRNVVYPRLPRASRARRGLRRQVPAERPIGAHLPGRDRPRQREAQHAAAPRETRSPRSASTPIPLGAAFAPGARPRLVVERYLQLAVGAAGDLLAAGRRRRASGGTGPRKRSSKVSRPSSIRARRAEHVDRRPPLVAHASAPWRQHVARWVASRDCRGRRTAAARPRSGRASRGSRQRSGAAPPLPPRPLSRSCRDSAAAARAWSAVCRGRRT